MPRTQLTTINRGSEAGLDLTGIDVAAEITDGNSFEWGPHRALYVANGDDASLNVTISTPGTVGRSGLAIADQVVAVPNGGARVLGPFGKHFRQSTGLVHVDYAGTTPTNITVAVIDMLAN